MFFDRVYYFKKIDYSWLYQECFSQFPDVNKYKLALKASCWLISKKYSFILSRVIIIKSRKVKGILGPNKCWISIPKEICSLEYKLTRLIVPLAVRINWQFIFRHRSLILLLFTNILWLKSLFWFSLLILAAEYLSLSTKLS